MNLHEALALVLSPVGAGRPRLDRWHFHHDRGGGGEVTPGRLRIQLTLRESRAGSWDRPELAALSPVIGQGGLAPRALIVDLTAEPSASGEPVDAHWDIAAPGGPLLRDDLDALVALRRMNPLVWLRGAQLVSPRDQGARTPGANASVDTPPEVAAVLEHYEHLLGGTTTWQEGDIDAGFAAAERFLMQWAPVAHARRPGARAVVAEILSHELEPAATAGGALSSKMPLASSTVQKLGVLVLTARLVEHLRHGATPGVRPIIVIEEPEAGLHPMTLASVWSLLERFSTQKIVATHSGTLLSVRGSTRCVDSRAATMAWCASGACQRARSAGTTCAG